MYHQIRKVQLSTRVNQSQTVLDPIIPIDMKLDVNYLVEADNLDLLHCLPTDCVDLIYLDPPFFSGRDYEYNTSPDLARSINPLVGKSRICFTDKWKNIQDYLQWMNLRIQECHRILKDSGSLCIHLDWHVSHYIKVQTDQIFGYPNFRNEIVWFYRTGSRTTHTFPRKHDVILWYGKTKHSAYYPEQIQAPINKCPTCGQKQKPSHLKKTTDESGATIREVKSTSGKIYRYSDSEDRTPSDVWLDIPHLHQRHPERTSYATQKPKQLLERIILALSKKGDWVLDLFCGSGTTSVVAQELERRWIACDKNSSAIQIAEQRIITSGYANYSLFQQVPDFVICKID